MRRLKKKFYLGLCGATLAVLTVVRWTSTTVRDAMEIRPAESTAAAPDGQPDGQRDAQSGSESDAQPDPQPVAPKAERPLSRTDFGRHPIRSVYSYKDCFPDVQDVQIVAARRWGVRPVRNREQAEHRKSELVYVGSNPYYTIDRGMSSSIPYLVPRAAHLLQDIGRNYLDSLAVKGVPLHRIIVTSVLRSEEDVARLLRKNGNASDQSCHRFGTTFDICYNRYNTVAPPGERRRAVTNDTLKYVLSEVLRDLRQEGRCYVKYEVKQGCFHITTR
ncbi:MAG: hypothetical protein IJT19_04125 [Bacteroidaceae bacterium]|nr:hypothetical protein [Bacteroidaceae bacterium]